MKAVVIKKIDDKWDMVAITTLDDDGNWIVGETLISDIDEAIEMSIKNKCVIITEKLLSEK